ncbi:YfdX family protein [Methylomonas methanica]|uniref:YfdX protein n=1 Tax=Methylomonas methanica (strain DSM 25384 / MC09) TaxID=857087 RepID=G0A320_METMM|nr:YfdX family protein [Methylomonas methanica]AEG02679.1 hypothetical protein Metme_4330 [Methylomonas methanica MC09]
MTTHKFVKYIPILTLIFGFSLLAHEVSAAEAGKEAKILDKVSKEGQMAVRELKWARVAIFDGNIPQAKDLLGKSKQQLAEVEKQAPELIVTVKTEQKIAGKTVDHDKKTITDDLVPIDAGLTLADDFVVTPEKQEKINKANEHLKNKEPAKAVQVLREADIGISVTRELMPVKNTIKHVDKAIELVDQHQYYEANLALKAAQDGLIIDSVILYEPIVEPTK